MKSLSDILDQLQNVDVGVKCRKCGAVPMMVGKQYTVRCSSCGTNITVSPNYLQVLKEREYKAKSPGKLVRRHKCSICCDQGYIILEEQLDEHVYEFGYRCLCRAGQMRGDLTGWPVVPAGKVKSKQDMLKTAWVCED